MSIRNLSAHLSVYLSLCLLEYSVKERLTKALFFSLTLRFFHFSFLLYEEAFSVPAVSAYQRKTLGKS